MSTTLYNSIIYNGCDWICSCGDENTLSVEDCAKCGQKRVEEKRRKREDRCKLILSVAKVETMMREIINEKDEEYGKVFVFTRLGETAPVYMTSVMETLAKEEIKEYLKVYARRRENALLLALKSPESPLHNEELPFDLFKVIYYMAFH
jgi:hypothetical protein